MTQESIIERLKRLSERFQDPSFLENKGLGNELGLHVFAYDPKDEMIVRKHIRNLISNNGKYNYHVHENDLFEMFLEICRDNDVLDDLVTFEEDEGCEMLLKQVENFAAVEEYLPKLSPKIRTKGRDIVIITGIGKVFPFMRSHTILENIQPIISDVPVVLFYPGDYDNHTLNLFSTLSDGNYYRAFKII